MNLAQIADGIEAAWYAPAPKPRRPRRKAAAPVVDPVLAQLVALVREALEDPR